MCCRLPILATSIQEQLEFGNKSSGEVPDNAAHVRCCIIIIIHSQNF